MSIYKSWGASPERNRQVHIQGLRSSYQTWSWPWQSHVSRSALMSNINLSQSHRDSWIDLDLNLKRSLRFSRFIAFHYHHVQNPFIWLPINSYLVLHNTQNSSVSRKVGESCWWVGWDCVANIVSLTFPNESYIEPKITVANNPNLGRNKCGVSMTFSAKCTGKICPRTLPFWPPNL